MTSLIDSHAHVDLPVFDEDREAMLHRASAAGIRAIVAIGHNPERWKTTTSLCQRHPFVVRTAGIHPNDASIWSDTVAAQLESELATGKPVAVGETGLDFYRDSTDPAIQRKAFAAQIELARRFDLPVVIHQRQAEGEVLEMLRASGQVRGVMHCFSGDQRFATDCLESGLMLGVGGVATYPKSDGIRRALKDVPLDAVILETDAPYLAPQRWRGKRNEPSYVAAVVEMLADLHGVSLDEIGWATSENAMRLFGTRLSTAFESGSGG